MIKEGDKIPQHKFRIRKHLSPEIACTFNEPIGEWGWLSTEEMFDNRRTVLFGVPGAFTPTCGKIHLPKFEMYYRKILSFGIDEIYCTAVNDPFVMDHWYRMNGVSYVKAAPDGSGEFADKLGMSADMSYLNYGKRTWRYSMLVNNGIVEKLFVEPGFPTRQDDPYKESAAETLLIYLVKNYQEGEMPPAREEWTRAEKMYYSESKEIKDLEEGLSEELVAAKRYKKQLDDLLEEEMGSEAFAEYQKKLWDEGPGKDPYHEGLKI